jgi:hypothetical protein
MPSQSASNRSLCVQEKGRNLANENSSLELPFVTLSLHTQGRIGETNSLSKVRR